MLFALPTSDRVITRTPLHLLYDFLYELLTSRLSRFSFRCLFSTARFILCPAQSFDAVVKVMSVPVALKRRIIYVFGDESLSRQGICASEFAVTPEGLTWISEGYHDFIICHSASLLWLKFLRGPVCTHLVFLFFDVNGLVNPQSFYWWWFLLHRLLAHFFPRKGLLHPCTTKSLKSRSLQRRRPRT